MNKKLISINPLEKALASLNKAIKQEKDEFTRDSVIQRFEYSFELSWKALQKVLEADKPLEDNSVKGIIRAAGRQNLISSVEKWFEFQKARNLTSHTYNEEVAEEVYVIAIRFPSECQQLIAKLKTQIAAE